MYEAGTYQPTNHIMIWLRRDIEVWHRAQKDKPVGATSGV